LLMNRTPCSLPIVPLREREFEQRRVNVAFAVRMGDERSLAVARCARRGTRPLRQLSWVVGTLAEAATPISRAEPARSTADARNSASRSRSGAHGGSRRGRCDRAGETFKRPSGRGVLQLLQRTHLDPDAGRLGGEPLLLLRERVDALALGL